jgi:nicotinamidase-related amidase
MTIKLPVRQYIAVPSENPKGLVTETWELPIEQTAFIELHCWNIGVPGGIPVPDDYWVFMGSKQNHERMAVIVETVIAPTMTAARQAGMPTVHVQSESIAARYPEFHLASSVLRPQQQVAETRNAQDVRRKTRHATRNTNHAVARANRVHGEGYMSWDGWSKLDVAPQLKPQKGDVMIATTQEFHEWLQAKGITTLIYTGFCTNLCILDSLAAMKAMSSHGYRCVLLREGTYGVEFADMPPNMHTEAAIRYVESWVGYTASVGDFVRALKS